MASEWTTFRLGDVCTKIGSGATPRGGSSVYLDHGDVTLIRSQNIYNTGFHHDGLVYLTDMHAAQLANVEVECGDILLNITGDSVARVCQVDPEVLPARVNQHVAIVRTNPRYLWPRYLRYFLVSPTMQALMLQLASAGATRNALTKGMIESFEISAPNNVKDQQAIACILGALDDKIELNRRMNRTLEEMARAIFKSWFVDFDPVRAKAAGQQPPNLKPEIAALFPNAFEESEQGEIPRGWRVTLLSELTTLITKGTTPTQRDTNNASESDIGVNFIRVNCIEEDGSILVDKLISIPESIHTGVLKRSILKSGDILYSIAGTIGRIAQVEDRILPANTNQAVAIIRPIPGIPPSFIVSAMSQERYQQDLHCNIVHAVQANLSLGMLAKSKIIVPNLPIQANLFKPIESIFSKIINSREQSSTLVSIRDSLLPKLISGELRVADAERIVGRCV